MWFTVTEQHLCMATTVLKMTNIIVIIISDVFTY